MHTPSKATFYSGSVSSSYTVGKYSGEIKQCFACLSEKRNTSSSILLSFKSSPYYPTV
jgi:hypothetical protein